MIVRTGVVLGCDVICQIVVQNETKQAIEQRQIDLLVDLRKHGLHQNVAFAFAGLPNVSQVVDALAPLNEASETSTS